MEFHSEVRHKSRDPNQIKENYNASCSRPKTKLRDFLMSDKPALLYADFHHEIIRNAGLGISKSSVRHQNNATRVKARDDEMARHISKLPSYLDKEKRCQEKPLAVTSLDWRHLDKLYKHDPMPTKSNGYSPSTSSNSYFSTDGSSSHSSRGNMSSPAQSHLEASPVKKKNYIQDECDSRRGSFTPARQRAYHPKHYSLQGRFEDVSSADSNIASEMWKQQKIGNLVLAFPVKGKMRIQESELKGEILQSHEPKESHRSILLLRDPSQKIRSSHLSNSSACYYKAPRDQRLKSLFQEDDVKEFHYCPLPSTIELRDSCSMATTTKGVNTSPQQFKSPLRSRSTVDKINGSESTSKVRQPSPIRRLSSAVGSFIKSAASRENSPLRRTTLKDTLAKPELDESCTVTSQANSRAKSSPMKRLLDPLLKSKAPNAREVIPKSTFDSGRIKSVKDSRQNPKQGSSLLQALLQVSVKNGLPLFTFAVDNNSDILAATPRKSSAPEKDCSGWMYTFFTVHEMKRKNGLWLNQGNKGNGPGYVPNVIAQMKASDGVNLREFTLFSVDTDQVDQHATEFQPTNELASIVAKTLKPASDKLETSQHLLSTTVILPGGVHTILSKGSISTLTQRWRSGGSCDCGGWDEGCQLRIFNQDECEKSSSLLKTAIASDEFKLFSQVGQETQLVMSLKPYKDRIYPVEFSSSISLLQAFGTSVAVLDCRRASGPFGDSNVGEGRASTAVISDDPFQMKVVDQSQGEALGGCVSFQPPHSPVGRV